MFPLCQTINKSGFIAITRSMSIWLFEPISGMLRAAAG